MVALALLGGGLLVARFGRQLLESEWASASLVETRRRARELASALSEKLPVYRAQLRATTCDLEAAGTDDAVLVRLNPDNATWLDYARDDFERGETFTYDLGLERVDLLGDISMLQLSTSGRDGWCVRRLALYVNDALIFDREYAPEGRWLQGSATDARTLTIPGEQLRRDRHWAAYRPPLPPSRVPRRELESRLEGAIGHALHGQRVRWSGRRGRAVALTRTSERRYRGELGLKLRLDNWPDPEIDVDFQLVVACEAGRLTMTVRELTFDVDSPWYADVATLGLADHKVEQRLRQAFGRFSHTRSTVVLICPPTLGIQDDGDLRLY